MKQLSVYILAYNEAEKLKAAIESVRFADEIIVVDSFSTDGTDEIARKLGAKVLQVPFNGFGDLRNKAIEACSYEWIFSLDSDERCTPEAENEIVSILSEDVKYEAYHVPRKNFFMGKWIKHSGFYPDYRQPQLFKKGVLSYTLDPVHEGFILSGGARLGYMKNAIRQIPYGRLEELQRKATRYSTLGAVKMEKEGTKSSMSKAFGHGLWAFLHHFVIKGGVLDGWPGFVIALGNFEGTFFKYAKLHEKRKGWDKAHLK